MKVSPDAPFQMIYSLYQFEDLGYIIQSYIIQLDNDGQPTLLYQNVSSKNVQEFSNGLDETDIEIVKLTDACEREALVKKFNTKKLPATDFFLKVLNPEKGDKVLRDKISTYLERYNAKILAKTKGKALYISGKDGYPAWKQIDQKPQKANVLFHLFRNNENIHYFPSIRYEHEKVEFQYKQAILICESPAWLLVNATLYHFDPHFDGKKLKPFLEKRFIPIPKKIEEEYLKKFVLPLLASHQVYTKGYDVVTESWNGTPLLQISDHLNESNTTSDYLKVELYFQYNNQLYSTENLHSPWHVFLEKTLDSFTFHKIKRNIALETGIIKELQSLNLLLENGSTLLPRTTLFQWIQTHSEQLKELGISVQTNPTNQQRYYLGTSSLSVTINDNENSDWFDVDIVVHFGPFEIPFIKLRKHILHRKAEFTLPNGEIAIIPEQWFTEYTDLIHFTELTSNNKGQLAKFHIPLVLHLEKDNLACVIMGRKLEALRTFEHIEEYPLPKQFKGELRPYQRAGYNWLSFLNNYKFGGCLADDMGLGKTVQTLALLQAQQEKGITIPSLLILPVSLIYNWVNEASKFTPELRLHVYTGSNRDKSLQHFAEYDLIVTSYGIARMDIEAMSKIHFHYVILDESQAIKNPTSLTTQAILQLHATHRLILTGTPLENSTLDIWSQMTFANPGLLGSQAYFKDYYLNPIEKNNDVVALQRLQTTIKPFILRRQKHQVAKDLPEKVESIHYSEMTEEQESVYESVKSQYRNQILEQIDKEGVKKSQFLLLQGLGQLRQIANHPVMTDTEYAYDSGKFKDVFHKIETALLENHKILLFSSFVKHLSLFKDRLTALQIPFAYLDGQTQNRTAEVERFQKDENVKIFLISIKAGGVGLNLTAADYVFILDPWWNPAVEAQAIDRAHRIGQDKTVFTYKFIMRNTVEEKILALQNRKKSLAQELITSEEGFVKSLSKEDIVHLLD